MRHPRASSALAFGLAVLGVLPLVAPLISAQHLLVYHFEGSAATLFLPVYVDFCALWLILSTLLSLAADPRSQALKRLGLLLAIPWIILKDWSLIRLQPLPHLLSVAVALLPVLGLVAAFACMRTAAEARRQAAISQLLKVTQAIFGALALSGLLILAQLTFCFWQAWGLNDAKALTGKVAQEKSPGAPRRVVILLFDELSAEQLTAPRAQALSLPAFDKLAQTSVVFANARPEGDQTDRAIPALLSGRSVQAVKASADGRTLRLRTATGWTDLSGSNTVFADALSAGYRTGVSGWFNPYCRLLSDVLDECEWHSPASLLDMGSGRGSLLVDSLQPVRRLTRKLDVLFDRAPPAPDPWPTIEHLRDYRRITAAADRMLRDLSLTFLFLHLPIPHQGGIYNRRTGAPSGDQTSYLDNLALADLYLAHVRKILEAQGDWDDTVLVAMGDHSWRTWMWAGGEFWTAEDAAASHGGRFDDRPALIVKLAGESSPAQVQVAFPGRRTRAMLSEIMHGHLQTPAQLVQWAGRGDSQARNVKP